MALRAYRRYTQNMKAFARERRALAASVFSFFAVAYGMFAFLAPGNVTYMLLALTAVYTVSFFALVAGYFWARWFALGVALFGALQGGLGIYQLGPEPVVVAMFAAHALAAGALYGHGMSALFEGQRAWRERYAMDDAATAKLGQAITRAGMSLPMVLLYAFAPRANSAAFLVAALAAAGIWQMVRLRAMALPLLAAAAAGSAAVTLSRFSWLGLFATGLLALALAPFVKPVLLHLRGRIS